MKKKVRRPTVLQRIKGLSVDTDVKNTYALAHKWTKTLAPDHTMHYGEGTLNGGYQVKVLQPKQIAELTVLELKTYFDSCVAMMRQYGSEGFTDRATRSALAFN